MQAISVYDSQFHSKNGYIFEIEEMLSHIKDGFYQDKVLAIRQAKNEYKKQKKRCEDFTTEQKKEDKELQASKSKLEKLKGLITRIAVSGTFNEDGRTETNLKKHSGLIDIDIDGLETDELTELKEKLKKDKYCYSCFTTCGGDGLSFIVKINGDKHKESFEGLQNYLFKEYGITGDEVHSNVANTRNVSYDPDLFLNRNSQTFKDYIKKEKSKPLIKYVHSKTDFDEIVREIARRGIDFCPDYSEYVSIGFAIASKYGLDGEYYFHEVCKNNFKYSVEKCRKQYKYCCREKSGITIATFYQRCKDFNIETYSKQTRLIISTASVSYKSGKTKADTIKNLLLHENIPESESEDIINQVFDEKIDFKASDSIIDDIIIWLNTNYELTYNQITNRLENKYKDLSDIEKNSIFIDAKKVFGKEANTALVKELIYSGYVNSYNPFEKYFIDNADKVPFFIYPELPKVVMDLWDSMELENRDFVIKFGTKWLVSIIGATYGIVSPLMLILQGEINVGKSEFFIRLLPKDLQKYFSKISKFEGKDFLISMCQLLLILDDEVSGKSKTEDNEMKRNLSSPGESIRLPFKETPIKMKRLAVLCGTSNNEALLSDPTGNRRFIPMKVKSRNFKKYDAIDRDELFMALHEMYKKGFDFQLTNEEIKELKVATEHFNSYSLEYELITKHYRAGNTNWTTSDIKVQLEKITGQKLNLNKIGQELIRLGYKKVSTNIDVGTGVKQSRQVYKLELLTEFDKPKEVTEDVKEDLPF